MLINCEVEMQVGLREIQEGSGARTGTGGGGERL